MLFLSGAVTRMGKITEGNTVCDFDDEEIRKGISVSTALAPIEWDGHKINILDAPGYADFIGELRSAMRVADLAVFVVSAVEGLEVQTQVAYNYAEELGIPRVFFVNKVDRENSSFRRTFDQLRDAFGMGVAPLSLPLGREHEFRGVISVIDETAFGYDTNGKPTEEAVPDDRKARLTEVRTALLDSVAETSDELLEKYLEAASLDRDEIIRALHDGIAGATVFPVMVGSATHLIGADRLLDAIVSAGPSPLDRSPMEGEGGTREPKKDTPMSAQIFKTMTDPYVGRVSFFRVYSGVFKGDGSV